MNPEDNKLVFNICEQLPDYTPDHARCRGCIYFIKHVSGDGRGFHIRQQGGRYHISPCWPRHDQQEYVPDYPFNHHISLSDKRGPDGIANEIKKRLLNSKKRDCDYDVAFAEATKKRDFVADHQNAEFALRDKILELTGDGALPPHLAKSTQVPAYRGGVRKVCVSGDTAKLELDYLPREVVFKVLEFLREHVGDD